MNNFIGSNFGNIYNLIYSGKDSFASRINLLKMSGVLSTETLNVLGESQIKQRFDFLNHASNFVSMMKEKKYDPNLAKIFHLNQSDNELYSSLKVKESDNADVKDLKEKYGNLAGEIKKESLNAKFMMAKLGKGKHEIKSPEGKIIANVNISDDSNFEMLRSDGSKVSISFSNENSEDCKISRVDELGREEKLQRKGKELSKEKDSECENYFVDKAQSLIREKTGRSPDDKHRTVAFKDGRSEQQTLLYIDDNGKEIYDIVKREAADTVKAKLGTENSTRGIVDLKTKEKLEADPAYMRIIEERHKNADPEVRALYDKYKKFIKIKDINYGENAHYSPGKKHINLNGTEDAAGGNLFKGDVYYHEVGHLIDNHIEGGLSYKSNNSTFLSAINSDFESCIDKITKNFAKPPAQPLERELAYKCLSETIRGGVDYLNIPEKRLEQMNKEIDELIKDAKAMGVNAGRNDIISNLIDKNSKNKEYDKEKEKEYSSIGDVFDGLSKGKVSNHYGHSRKYWNDEMLCAEAFTHMFEVFMGGDKRKRKYLKEIMPNTYDEFMKIVRAQTAQPEGIVRPQTVPLKWKYGG